LSLIYLKNCLRYRRGLRLGRLEFIPLSLFEISLLMEQSL
jgi:hypothetical protein